MIANVFAQPIKWGEPVSINISKSEVEKVFEEYVEKTYPQKIAQYNHFLAKQKEEKIAKYSSVTYVNGDLMWQDNQESATKKLNVLEFRFYCKGLSLAQKRDWRVPLYSELLTLVDYTLQNPAAKKELRYIAPERYWSGSTKSLEKKSNWFVDFFDGTTNFDHESQKYHIRCVRDISKKAGEY